MWDRGGSGNILQTRIVEILEFSRCLVSISQGNMHRFNSVSLAIKYLLIRGRKYAHKYGNGYSPSVKPMFFTSVVCASYNLGEPGRLTSSSCAVSQYSTNYFVWEIGLI